MTCEQYWELATNVLGLISLMISSGLVGYFLAAYLYREKK